MNGEQHWDPVEWKAVADCSTAFFHDPDAPLNLRDMLVSASQVDHRATWECFNKSLEWCKFTVRMYRSNVESSTEVVLVYLLECLKDLGYRPIRKMIDGREIDLPTQGQEKWNLVDKKYIDCHENLLVELQKLRRDLDRVPCHSYRLAASGLSFQRCEILAPYLRGSLGVFDSDRAIFDLIAADDPLEISSRWITKCSVQHSSNSCFLHLSFGIVLHVLRDGPFL